MDTELGRLDACPACAPGDAPAAFPQPADDPAVSAYQCPSCGTGWQTRWGADGWPVGRLRAA